MTGGADKVPADLSAHKSQIERRRRKAVRSEMVGAARDMASRNNVVAYAIVGMSDDGRCFAAWDTGGILPMWAFPATAWEVLRVSMASSGVEDDFKKPLTDAAWRGSKP